MSYHENDHFEGIYTFENEKDKPFPSTIAQVYRNKRKQFLTLLSNVREEHKTRFIKNHIDREENELKEKDIYAKYENREIFD